VVDADREAGIAPGDVVYSGQEAGREDHHRQGGALGEGPDPIGPAVE
jgi:hypothetical protein